MLLSEFKKLCTPFQFYSIGVMASAYHPKVYKIDEVAIKVIARELEADFKMVIFALKVYLVGITDVLGYYNRIKDEAFSEQYQRIEMGAYYVELMLEMRNLLRFKPRFVDTFLAFAVQSPKVMQVLVDKNQGIEGTKSIMLFCGVSVYSLFMVCDPISLTPDENERSMIWEAQKIWQLRRQDYFGGGGAENNKNGYNNGSSGSSDDVRYYALTREQKMALRKEDVWGHPEDEPDWMENIMLLIDYKATTTIFSEARRAIETPEIIRSDLLLF